MLRATTRFAELARHVFLYNGTAMAAAAIACLALAILFILLLHIYAKRLLQAHSRLRSSSSEILSSSRRFAERATGLDDSVVASIPIFLYNSTEHRNQYGSECVVCLSEFEEDEVGRALPECGHCFHVECIDMWLYSHSNCPICRAPVVSDNNVTVKRERKALQLASRSFDDDCP